MFGEETGGGERRGACRERARGVWVPFFGERLTPPSARKYCYLDRAFRARNVLQNAMQRPGRGAYDFKPSATEEKSAIPRARTFLILLFS